MFALHEHASIDGLAEALAQRLEALLAEAVTVRGTALLALAGGRTPMPVYRRLAARALPWSQLRLVATDERWVGMGHPARNEDELRRAFAAAHGLQILPLVPPQADAPPDLDTALANLDPVHAQPFDAVLLGMGADAHTASLFPLNNGLAAALDPESCVDACVIHPDPLPPEAPYPRISLTARRLLATRALLLAITGEGKRAVLQQALQSTTPLQHPVSVFLQQYRVPVEIHWSP
jgi:6-phosphogluconolactonase